MSRPPTRVQTKTSIAEWIRDWLSRNLNLESNQIADDRTFVSYGMDSLHAMTLVGDLEDHLALRLSPTLAWEYPTIDALAGYLDQHPTNVESEDVDALLDRVDTLSEEEIDAILRGRKPL